MISENSIGKEQSNISSSIPCWIIAAKIGVKEVKIDQVPQLLEKINVFTFAESLGGVESLITYPTTQTHADIPEALRESYGLTKNLVRLSIGIEDSDDLIGDLNQALKR